MKDKDLFNDVIVEMTPDEAYDFIGGLGGNSNTSYSYIDELRKDAAERGIDDPTDDPLWAISMGIDAEDDLWGNEDKENKNG